LYAFAVKGRLREFHVVLNFDPTLACIITETKYLEQIGFTVPELARNIALQVVPVTGEQFLLKVLF